MHRFLAILILLTATVAQCQLLPVERTPGGRGSWTTISGLPQEWPTNTTVYTNINILGSANATTLAISNALRNCPSNQVVCLTNPGTYFTDSELLITHNGVTLRGTKGANGAPLTTIKAVFNGVCIGNPNAWFNEFATPNTNNWKIWSGGFAQGSTNITVSSTNGMVVGNLLFLTQLNDPDTTYYSPANPDCVTPNCSVAGNWTSLANPGNGKDSGLFQVNRIKALDGTNVALSEPIYVTNFNSTFAHTVWFETVPGLPVERSFVEDLNIDCTTGGALGDVSCVHMQYTYGCGTKNCYLTGPNAHEGYIDLTMCLRFDLHHNYLYGPNGADNYGINTRMCAGGVVYDNIFTNCGTPMMVVGVSGTVYAYNYATNLQFIGGFLAAGLLTHGATPNMNLFEGNYCPMFGMNSQWQNSLWNVGFRNRFTGHDDGNKGVNGNIEAVEINATNYYHSLIGNLLGTPGFNTNYLNNGTTSCDLRRVLYLGLEHSGASCAGVYDPKVEATLDMWGNWTSGTFTNGGVVLGGHTTNELTGVNSLYWTSKPAFFGTNNYPPFDPAFASLNNAASSNMLGGAFLPAFTRLVTGFDPSADTTGGGGGGGGSPPPATTISMPISNP